MTLTFNPEKYKELLARHLPKVIRTEAENEKALVIVEELMHRQHRTPEEDELYQLLILLIENFERSFYLQESTTPNSMLLFLMEQQSVNKKDIAIILGSDKIASSLIAGKGSISQEQAKLLGHFFHVDYSLFMQGLLNKSKNLVTKSTFVLETFYQLYFYENSDLKTDLLTITANII